MTEKLKRCGDVLNRSGSEIFQGENAEFVGANALLFLQLLIALVTMSAVKASAISIGFLLVSIVRMVTELWQSGPLSSR